MRQIRKILHFFALGFVVLGVFISLSSISMQVARAENFIQLPTVAIPTVTGTPGGPYVTVRPGEANEDQINVRSGPGVNYPKVGILLVTQKAPAKGRSAGGDWILIEYPGVPGGLAWVYANLVNVVGGTLPVVAPPSTPTPLFTSTIDPTLMAQYPVTRLPSRMPTFTQAPPLNVPTYAVETSGNSPGGLPMGLVIASLFSMGLILGIFSFVQGR